MQSIRIAIVSSVAVLVLGGCSADQPAEGSADAALTPAAEGNESRAFNDGASADSAASQADAGAAAAPESRAFIDPVTGEMRAPTAAELAAMQPAESTDPAVKQRPAQVEGTRLPDGTIRYDMSNQPPIEERVCVQPDGAIGPCPAK
jgi:hypothetical protein